MKGHRRPPQCCHTCHSACTAVTSSTKQCRGPYHSLSVLASLTCVSRGLTALDRPSQWLGISPQHPDHPHFCPAEDHAPTGHQLVRPLLLLRICMAYGSEDQICYSAAKCPNSQSSSHRMMLQYAFFRFSTDALRSQPRTSYRSTLGFIQATGSDPRSLTTWL